MARITIRFDGEEYRVPGPNGTEEQAYYTNDKDDAIGTARLVFGPDVVTKIKRGEELV